MDPHEHNRLHKLAADCWINDVSNSHFSFQPLLLAAIRIHWLAHAYAGGSLRVQGTEKQKIQQNRRVPLY